MTRGRRVLLPTEREVQVFVATIECASEKRAAHALGVSFYTVKHHLNALYQRIGATDRPHAAWLLWPLLHERYRLPGDERRVAQRRAA